MSITIKIRNPNPQNEKPKWFTTSKIDNDGGIIVYGKLGSINAVGKDQIVENAITGDKIAEGCITAKHLYAPTDESFNKDRPVKTNSIQNEAVTGVKIASGHITTNHIEGGAITTDKLAGDGDDGKDDKRAVTTNKIRNNAITAAKLSSSETNDAVRAVTANAIQNKAIIAGKLFTVNDNEQDSNKKLMRPVVGDSIQDDTIPWSKMNQKLYQLEKTEKLNYLAKGEETVPDYCFNFLFGNYFLEEKQANNQN